MIVFVFNPFDLRHHTAANLREFYWILSTFKGRFGFILPADYLHPVEVNRASGRWEAQEGAHAFPLPTTEMIRSVPKAILPGHQISDMEGYRTTIEFERNFLSGSIVRYELELLAAIDEFECAHGGISLILHLGACELLRRVLAMRGIPLRFWEGAPLRSPYFPYHVFLDQNGIGGNTSLETTVRYNYQVNENICCQFTHSELLYLLALEPFGYLSRPTERVKTIGIPLQVEVDNNVLAFSNGWDLLSLMDAGRLCAGYDDVLIRKHPLGVAEYQPKYGVIDNSKDSLEFLSKVTCVLTLNSSVAFEAILLGMGAFILGELPYAFLANGSINEVRNYTKTKTPPQMDVKEHSGLLVSLVLGALVPGDHFLDEAFLLKRISNPSFEEVFLSNLRYLASLRGLEVPPALKAEQAAHFVKCAIAEPAIRFEERLRSIFPAFFATYAHVLPRGFHPG